MKTKEPAGWHRAKRQNQKRNSRLERQSPGEMSFAAVLGLIAALVIPRPENALEDVGLTRQKA